MPLDMRTSYLTSVQSRLGYYNDRLRRKIVDNNLRWISHPTDCIRTTHRKTFEGDSVSYIVERADIVPIIFPPLEEVPIRKIRHDK
jgi:hypothetical protein